MGDRPDGPSLLAQLRALGAHKIAGMTACCNKATLALSLNFVAELHAELMPWWPPTFILPRDLQAAAGVMRSGSKAVRTFIYKPDAAYGGAGVVLAQTGESLQDLLHRKTAGCAVLQ
jgi:hypothetical protein